MCSTRSMASADERGGKMNETSAKTSPQRRAKGRNVEAIERDRGLGSTTDSENGNESFLHMLQLLGCFNQRAT